jgi:hypothetical protein
MKIPQLTAEELVASAEVRLADADRNLASCAASLQAHRQERGGVPNAEVVALVHAQAAVAQAYAAVALAKSGIAVTGQAVSE